MPRACVSLQAVRRSLNRKPSFHHLLNFLPVQAFYIYSILTITELLGRYIYGEVTAVANPSNLASNASAAFFSSSACSPPAPPAVISEEGRS